MTRPARIAVVYYSATGNVHRLAHALAEGAGGEEAEVRVRHVEGLLPLIDAAPSGRAVALAKDVVVGDVTEALTWDGTRFQIAPPGAESDDAGLAAPPVVACGKREPRPLDLVVHGRSSKVERA